MENEVLNTAIEVLSRVELAVMQDKFASYGIVPQTEEQVGALLACVQHVMDSGASLHPKQDDV